jgi:AcrR family transcriptional regulator
MRDQKARTRERIVQSAGRLFRRYGYNGVGIDDIMAAANLTRGGFYAHFGSKQDLFAATLAAELELTRRLRDSGEPDGEQLSGAARALIEFYLDGRNRKRIPTLCPLVSLSPDVARAGDAAGAAYTATLQDVVAEIARRIPGDPADASARALAAVALCVGGVVLAQAVSDEQLADALLAACRTRVLAELEAR